MRKKVIIIGQGYTGRLSIIRSVAGENCEIAVVALLPRKIFAKRIKKKPLDAYSKYVEQFFYCENYNEDMLIRILLEKCADAERKAFIFPDNDFSAAAIDRHRDQLKAFFHMPHIREEQGAVMEWMDKVRQKELAKSVGLNVVPFKQLEVKNRTFQIPEGIVYPCFVKPMVSIFGGKSGLRRCNSEKELKEHVESFLVNYRNDDVRFLIEDYKKIDREYATLGFSDGEEVIIPGLLELLKIAHRSHFGVALQGRVFPVTGFEELVGKFRNLVKEVGFAGIFDIDFFESEGKMYFCELNLRFGGSGFAFTKMGVNLPVMMMKSFLREGLDGMQKAITGKAIYFNERMAIDDWYFGYLTTEEFLKIRAESDIRFVDNADDPMPQKVLEKEFMSKRIKKTIKGWILMK